MGKLNVKRFMGAIGDGRVHPDFGSGGGMSGGKGSILGLEYAAHPLSAWRDRAFTEGPEPVITEVPIVQISGAPTLCRALGSAEAAGTVSFLLGTRPAAGVRPILEVRTRRASFLPEAKSVLPQSRFPETLVSTV